MPDRQKICGSCIRVGSAIVAVGGPVQTMDTSKGPVAFEWHDYLGPMPINRRTGNERLVGPRHPFWSLVTAWAKQGKRVENGRCIVGPTTVCAKCGGTGMGLHLGGRNYMACPDCDGA